MSRTLAIMMTMLLALGIAGCTDRADAQEADQQNDKADAAQAPQQVAATMPVRPQPGHLLDELIDNDCVIRLRYDVLGQHLDRTTLQLATDLEQQGVTITGRLIAYDDDWLVMDVDGRRCWVPRKMILLVEADN